MPDNEPMGYWDSLDKGIDLENEYREQRAAGQVESEENPEIQAQAVEPVEGEEKDEDNLPWYVNWKTLISLDFVALGWL